MDKFFYARSTASGVETRGDASVSLGNKVCDAFAEWTWDGQRLKLENDRYGVYPIYYFLGENEIAISPSIDKLLSFAGEIELDYDALAVFLRLGWLLSDDTLFMNIRAVGPGSTLIWEGGDLTLTSHGVIKSDLNNIGRQDAIEAYARLFRQSIERTAPAHQDFAVPISGGRDSRHILLELCESGRRPAAGITVVPPPPITDEDAKVAKILCGELSVELQTVDQNASIFAAEVEKNVLTGYTVNEHGWFMVLRDVVRGGWRAVYDGIAGDVLSAGLFLDETRLRLFHEGKLKDLAENILGSEGYLEPMLTREVRESASRERAVRRVLAELEIHAHEPNPVGSFCFWNRTRRCIGVSPFRIFGDEVEIVTPYLERELFDFLSSLPAEMMVDHAFHTETIAYAYPDHTQIPYAAKDGGSDRGFKHFRKLANDVFRFSLKRGNRHLVNRKFVAPRALLAIADPKRGASVADWASQAIHLLQLERL